MAHEAHKAEAATVPLPVEILSTILANLTLDLPSLLSAALVSHFWNDCATPVLYREIEMKWDSSRGPPLLRTLEAKPHLLPVIRSMNIDYTRVGEWANQTMREMQRAEFARLVELRVPGRDEEERMLALSADRQAYYRRFELDEEARNNVRPRCEELIEATVAGGGDWMDLGEGGEERRRDGACALLQMASRCPRLARLALRGFDVGYSEIGTVLQDRLGFDLPAVVELHLEVVPWHTWPIILVRTPNLQTLDMPYLQAGGFSHSYLQAVRLRSLRSLTLGGLRREQLDAARDLLNMGRQSLRTVSLRTNSDEGDFGVAALLSHAPNIETLRVLRHRVVPTPEFIQRTPSPLFLTYLSSSTSLRTLHLDYAISQTLLDALPPCLISFSVLRPSAPPTPQDLTPDLADTISSILTAKATRLVALEKCTLHAPPGEPLEDAVVRLVKEAAEAGLKIVT